MNLPAQIINAALAISLVLTHLFAYKLKSLGGTPRSIWLSIAGGVTVAHVFLGLFPELKIGENVIDSHWLQVLEHPIYLFLMLGLCVFYALERRVAGEKEENDKTSQITFFIHIAVFTIYNLVLVYILSYSVGKLEVKHQIFLIISYVLHFMVNDFSMQQKHEENYIHTGRWLLAGGACVGWILSKIVSFSEQTTVLITAFLAGAIVLNMIKEELPSERKSKAWALLVGVLGFSALIILT